MENCQITPSVLKGPTKRTLMLTGVIGGWENARFQGKDPCSGMSTKLTRRQTPEEQELQRKRAQLAALEIQLAPSELDLESLRTELGTFESSYLRVVGILYADLDEIEAQIAEANAYFHPNFHERQEEASRARTQAQESAETARTTKELRPKPSENLKILYHDVAKSIHPDLSIDPTERGRRERLMAEANLAYEEGNEAKLQAILDGWESSPESIKGEGAGAELVRVIRKIAQVEERLRVIEKELADLNASDLCQLKIKIEEAEKEGRDLFEEMASQIRDRIAEAKDRLAALSTKKSTNA